jgi:uncharacterized protein
LKHWNLQRNPKKCKFLRAPAGQPHASLLWRFFRFDNLEGVWYICFELMNRILHISVLFVTLLVAVSLARALTFPAPQGYVSDYAGVVTDQERAQIEAICRELDEKTGAQIAVAVFPDLGGEDYTDYAVRLFEHWKIGKKGKDNGVLILNTLAERKVRIEVGYGLEPIIPDGLAGQILRDNVFPLLREEKYGAAYLTGAALVAAIVARDAGVRLATLENLQISIPSSRRQANRPFPIWILPPILLFLAYGFRSKRHSRLGPPILPGFWGGGGFGGFGGGGGGFGGFGGGMSGGGGAGGGY